MENLNTFIQLVMKGGFFVYPIIISSIFAVAIFLFKLWSLRRKKIVPEEFTSRLSVLLRSGKLADAKLLCSSSGSSLSRIASTALENNRSSRTHIQDQIVIAGKGEARELGKYIEALGSISNISTLLGLLGTISGMIKIFAVISEKDIVNPQALAGGISEALYSTAIGLTVAIPAFVAYKFISARYAEYISLLEEESSKILDITAG
ncbi:MAG: MotA/TolQ/ExbB proton channel family protein [Thermodesulfobacteriota bacterium]